MRLLGLFLLLPCFCFGQITFQKKIGTISSEWAESIDTTNDGGYIMCGICPGAFGLGGLEDIYVVRTDINGDTLWTRAYGQPGDETATTVKQTADGGFILCGRTGSFINWRNFLIKIDSNGNTVWTKVYASPGGGEYANSLVITNDNGFAIGGFTTGYGTGLKQAYLIRTDSLGNVLWTKLYGGAGEEWITELQVTNDGGFILVGTTDSYGAGLDDILVMRTDSMGDILWTKTYGGADFDQGASIDQTTAGGFIVTGFTYSFGAGNQDIYLININGNGDTLWTKALGSNNWDVGTTVRQTTDGGYILLGSVGNTGIHLIKTDITGDTLWTKTFGGNLMSFGSAGHSRLLQTADGGYAFANAKDSQLNSFDMLLIKTDSNGNAGPSGCNTISLYPSISNTQTIVTAPSLDVLSGVVSNTVSMATAHITTLDSFLCDTGTQILEIKLNQPYSLYPNPTTGVFIVAGATGTIEVLDIFGRLVSSTTDPSTGSGSATQIDLSHQPRGIYFVRAGQAVRKLILH